MNEDILYNHLGELGLFFSYNFNMLSISRRSRVMATTPYSQTLLIRTEVEEQWVNIY